MHWFLTYLVCLVVFLLVDGLWIGLVANRQYKKEAGSILRKKPQLAPGVIFYLIYVAGTLIFAVLPLTKEFKGKPVHAGAIWDFLRWGGGLGIFAYATFGLTNQSILKAWKIKLVFADVLWGAVITAIVTLIGFSVFRGLGS